MKWAWSHVSAKKMQSSSFLFCEVCGVQTSSDDQLRSHLLGQRHWYNKRQREESQRSVYVKGLPLSPEPKQEEIREVFEQFGNISMVIIHEKQQFAIVQYSNVDSALSVLHHPYPILLRGTSLTVRPREVKIKQKKNVPSNSTDVEEQSIMEASPVNEKPKMKVTSVEEWSEQLNLNVEKINEILQQQKLDDQIRLLASFLHLSKSSLEPHVQLLSSLQSHLSSAFPLGRVLPFGSLVTGLATPTSDVDAVLLTEWTKEDEQHFGYEFYLAGLPSEIKPGTTAAASHTQQTEEMMETNHESSLPLIKPHNYTAAAITKFSIPAHVKICGARNLRNCSEEYKIALSIVGNIPDCTKIIAVSTARCPIIRFSHEETGLHCDISINNRLAPHNSRLLKAYLNFDPRVIPLLLILRTWIRICGVSGIGRTQLNNYALALMLIYSLQRANPPVLPSLQSPGPWPRNMEWYEKKGFVFSGVREVPVLDVEGWNVGFIDPGSLLQSTNKASIGELLLHFLNFYSNQFSFANEVVAVHSPLNTQLTIDQTSTTANEAAPKHLPHKWRFFKVGCICVQDPMELTHNVTKSLNPGTLAVFIEGINEAFKVMSEIFSLSAEMNILALFSSKHHRPSPVKPPKLNSTFYFSLRKMSVLLSKVPTLSSLVEHLTNLDISSQYVISRLEIVVIKALVYILENELSFECRPKVTHSTHSSSSSFVSPVTSSFYSISNPLWFDFGEVETGQVVRKRQRDSETGDGEIDFGDDNPIQVEELKKARFIDNSSSSVAILEQYCFINGRELYPTDVLCTAFHNTWVHRRRLKRQLCKDGPSSSSMPSSSQLEQNSPPILQFSLTSIDKDKLPHEFRWVIRGVPADILDKPLVWIQLKATDISFGQEFSTFSAYFKKPIFS